MFKRNLYLEKIRPFIDTPTIKVITGMRRVGKSCFLRLLMDDLLERDVPRGNICYIDKESLRYEAIRTYRELNETALAAFRGCSGRKYLFVDEVQEVDEWERAVVSLARDPGIDIYLTGSNAHMLSGELATLLSGRYVEFPIYSLSFAEFLQFREAPPERRAEEFRLYLRFGGLPGLHHLDLQDETVYQYINAIYSTIVLKDIVKRHRIRDVSLLENIGRYLFDNIGNVFSANRISDYLRSQRLRIGVATVQNYVRYFTDALAAYRVPRFDLKGKRYLEIGEKYFLGDTGLRHAVLGFREGDINGILENIVYLELLRRGYRVCIGKQGEREVDFVATRQNEKLYVQVAYLLASPETVEREFGALRAIPDNYPKLVLSMDTAFGGDIEGIRRIELTEFLLQDVS